MGPRLLTPALRRGTPAQPEKGSFLKPEMEQEDEEMEEEEEDEDPEETAKPEEAEYQRKNTKRKEKSLQRLLMHKKNNRMTRKILQVVMEVRVVKLQSLQKSHHCPHLHLSQRPVRGPNAIFQQT